MAIQFLGSQILFVSGQIAMDPACCCEAGCPGNCDGCCATYAMTIAGSTSCNGTFYAFVVSTCLWFGDGPDTGYSSIGCSGSTWTYSLWQGGGGDPAVWTAPNVDGCPPTTPADWSLVDAGGCGGTPEITVITPTDCP